jgi:hypothetical protein
MFSPLRSLYLLIWFLGLQQLGAWDVTGHRVVGEIAQQHLSAQAKLWVKNILQQEELFSASTWADEIKSKAEWKRASSWHYLNCPANILLSERKKSDEGDVLVAMEAMMKILLGSPVSAPFKGLSKNQALKFLIHFVGDLHQPLHVGWASDKGGNDVSLYWFEQKTNFHRLWDQHLVDHYKLSFTEWLRFLDNKVTEADKKKSKKSLSSRFDDDFLSWAMESREALNFIYPPNQSLHLGYAYVDQFSSLLWSRLYLAGWRLNHVIEFLASQKHEVNRGDKRRK